MSGTFIPKKATFLYFRATIGGLSLNIYGVGLELVGSAIATATAYIISGTLMFAALYRNKLVSPKGKKIKLHIPIMKRCIKVGFPVTIERVVTCLGHVVFSSLVTGLGTVAFAARFILLFVRFASGSWKQKLSI